MLVGEKHLLFELLYSTSLLRQFSVVPASVSEALLLREAVDRSCGWKLSIAHTLEMSGWWGH